jgi:hypothetical protein
MGRQKIAKERDPGQELGSANKNTLFDFDNSAYFSSFFFSLSFSFLIFVTSNNDELVIAAIFMLW